MDGDDRWGKSRLALVNVIERCLTFEGEVNPLTPETIAVVLPTLVQAKRVLWRPLQNVFEKIPGVEINKSEHRIIVPGKPNILLAGAEGGEGLRGLRLYFVALDEFQDVKPNFLNEVVRPAMADTPGSRLLITGTPKGKVNHLYKISQEAGIDFFNYPTESNPFVSRSEIERARRNLPDKVFRQEFFADFVSFGGKIYSEFDDKVNIFSQLPGKDRAYIGVDFGDVNPAFVVVVMRGHNIYVVEAKQLGDGVNPVPIVEFERQLVEACRRWDVYRVYCDPSRPASIMDLRRRGKLSNIAGLERAIAADNKINPGLALVNALFYQKRLFIDGNDQSFIDEVISYHRKPIKGTDEFDPDKVEDGQTDHRLDALRYCLYSIDVRSKGRLLNPVE